jgi:DNA-binding response OmpR family regulator
LVVEDDPPVSRLIETHLKREGLTVDAANGWEGGLVLARTFQPGLIMLAPDTARHGRRMRPPRRLRGS